MLFVNVNCFLAASSSLASTCPQVQSIMGLSLAFTLSCCLKRRKKIVLVGVMFAVLAQDINYDAFLDQNCGKKKKKLSLKLKNPSMFLYLFILKGCDGRNYKKNITVF